MLRLVGVETAAICASCAVQQVPMDVGSTFGVASDGPSGTRATGRVGAQKPAVPAKHRIAFPRR
jgi:hydrogenase maturation factor HypE